MLHEVRKKIIPFLKKTSTFAFSAFLCVLGNTDEVKAASEFDCCSQYYGDCNSQSCSPCRLSVYADLLIWASFRNDIYAQDLAATAPAEGGKDITIPISFSPGFRIGFEYPLVGCGCEGWNIFGSYLWYYSGRNDTAHSADLSSNLFNIDGAKNVIYNNASAKSRLHWNVFELAARKDIPLTSCILIRPYVGLVGISFELKRNYEFTSTGNPTATDTIYKDKKIYGAGPLFGIAFDWRFKDCWTLRGKSTAGVALGHYKAEQKEQYTTDLYNKRTSMGAAAWWGSVATGIYREFCWCGHSFDLGIDWEAALISSFAIQSPVSGVTLSAGYQF